MGRQELLKGVREASSKLLKAAVGVNTQSWDDALEHWDDALALIDQFRPAMEAKREGTPGPNRLALSLEVSWQGGADLAEVLQDMAVLSARLGVTVHAKLNGDSYLAAPGDSKARMYMRGGH
ncbi:unnamed protein product [marine sediment metagenome]|uniref:Uncharacterized protein n=1 Tax=marine sediment metagenome TaxID=412755 RepID=X0SWG8_9ZZZZ